MKTYFYLPSTYGDCNYEFIAEKQLTSEEYNYKLEDNHNRFNSELKNATTLLKNRKIKLLSQHQIDERLEQLKNVSSIYDKVPTWIYNEDETHCEIDTLFNYAKDREPFIVHFEFDFYDLSNDAKEKIRSNTHTRADDFMTHYNSKSEHVHWCKETQSLYSAYAKGRISEAEFYKGLPYRDFRVQLENGKFIHFLDCQIIAFPIEGNYSVIQVLVGALIFER